MQPAQIRNRPLKEKKTAGSLLEGEHKRLKLQGLIYLFFLYPLLMMKASHAWTKWAAPHMVLQPWGMSVLVGSNCLRVRPARFTTLLQHDLQEWKKSMEGLETWGRHCPELYVVRNINKWGFYLHSSILSTHREASYNFIQAYRRTKQLIWPDLSYSYLMQTLMPPPCAEL